MKIHLFFEGFNNAIEGIIYVLKTQKNMKIHFATALAVLLFGIFVGIETHDYLFLCTAIGMVLFAEMINTAIEISVDMISDSYHPLARVVKDVSAGAVMIASLFAIAVGYIVLAPHLVLPIKFGIAKIKTSSWHLSFIALSLVIIITVVMKIFLHRGTPLHGGMPSGHAAISFAIWTITSLISESTLVVILVFILAAIVAMGRYFQKIHSFGEILIGALLGVLSAIFVFQLYVVK